MGEHLYKIGRSSVTEEESVLNTLTPSVVPFPFIMGWFTIHGTNVTALSVPTSNSRGKPSFCRIEKEPLSEN